MEKRLSKNGMPWELTEKQKKGRALKYAKCLVAFQSVGMGADEYLELVRETVLNIRSLCYEETGIKLDTYPTEFVKKNEK